MGKSRDGKIDNSNARRRASRGSQRPASYLDVDAELLRKTIEIVGKAGGALRLGFTRDGGAIAVGVYGDGDPYTEYLRPSDDIQGYFEELGDDFGGADNPPK